MMAENGEDRKLRPAGGGRDGMPAIAWVGAAVGLLFAGVLAFHLLKAGNQVVTGDLHDDCLENGSNIYKALIVFSAGNEGRYPDGENANAALGEVVDDLTSERPFFIRGSLWHGEKFKEGPDNRWEGSDPPGITLEAGENAWSYVRGLNPESPAHYPVLGAIYGDHFRSGKKRIALIVFADGSGESFKVGGSVRFPRDLYPDYDWIDPLPPPS